MPDQSSKKSPFLPAVIDLKAAQLDGRKGVNTCLFIMGITILRAFTIPSALNSKALTFSLLIYGILALMIYKMSRTAAILAFLLYLIDCIFLFAIQGISMGIFIQILLLISFLNSIEGTFAYHRLRHQRQEAIQEETEAVL
jgi:hypothetical protein